MKSNRGPKSPEDLRTRAEECLKSERDRPADTCLEEANSLIHELRVHQIELEMQNEELRRVQNDLEISRSRYADLYDFAPVGYFTLNKNGQIVDLNMTAARLLGTERGLLVNSHFQYFVFQPDKKEFLSHLNAIFDKRERQIIQVRLSPKDGEQFYARLESIYTEGEDGAGLCRTNMSDVTLHKRAEQVLQNAHDELERCVDERTAELRTAIARLEQANQQLQEFVHVASHDLQEPLRKIQTFCDMAMKRCAPVLDSTSREHLDRVLSSAAWMRQLLRDLLQFSRLDAQSESLKRVDLGEIALAAADVHRATIRDTGCQIEIKEMPSIEADEGQMLLLFQNLIGNSVKFRSGQPPRIYFYGKRNAQGMCEINVKDNGIGFDPQYAELVFKPFQRLHGRSEYDGTGLGPAICCKIVERNGGNIRAQSELGKGSTFIIRMPVEQDRWEGI